MVTKKALKNLINTIYNYENDDRTQFLSGKYVDYTYSDEWKNNKDKWATYKKECPMCVVGWLAINKDIELPSYVHDLRPTGYVYKGEAEVSVFKNGKKVGTEIAKYPVKERACECELHTPNDSGVGEYYDREKWIDDDYMDNGITYSDADEKLVPDVDEEQTTSYKKDIYKEFFLGDTINYEYENFEHRQGEAMEKFATQLRQEYGINQKFLEHMQNLNDNPTMNRLHILLQQCSDDCSVQSFFVKQVVKGGWLKPLSNAWEKINGTPMDIEVRCTASMNDDFDKDRPEIPRYELLLAFLQLLYDNKDIRDLFSGRKYDKLSDYFMENKGDK